MNNVKYLYDAFLVARVVPVAQTRRNGVLAVDHCPICPQSPIARDGLEHSKTVQPKQLAQNLIFGSECARATVIFAEAERRLAQRKDERSWHDVDKNVPKVLGDGAQGDVVVRKYTMERDEPQDDQNEGRIERRRLRLGFDGE